MKRNKKIQSLVLIIALLVSFFSGISVNAASYEDWKQGDSRWGDIKLGTASGKTVRTHGCAVTCIAIACAKLGLVDDEFNPGTLVNELNGIGGFTNDGGIKYAKPTEIVPGLSFVSSNTPLTGTDAEKAATISKYCTKDQVCIVEMSYIKKNGKEGTHFVVVNYVDGEKV